MGVLEWMIGLGVAGYASSKLKEKKEREEEEEYWRRIEEEEAKREQERQQKEAEREFLRQQKEAEYERLKQAEEEYRNQALREEIIRRNTICLFEDGISRKAFESIVMKECRRIKRISSAHVDGAVLEGFVRAQSGISEWRFKIDFNDYGQITGNFWVWAENDDSNIPGTLARNICSALRDYKTSPSHEQSDHAESNTSARRTFFCPYCGHKQPSMKSKFCSNCGKKLPLEGRPSTDF